jgi:uncharacterized protein (TIGR02246 family)
MSGRLSFDAAAAFGAHVTHLLSLRGECMQRKYLFVAMIAAAALFAAACGDQAANNTANKPANAANNAANTATTAVNHEAEIKKLMTDLGAALAKNDADAAAKFYSDDYHLITPQGVDQPRAERIADMKSGTTKFESFTYENVSVRSYGDTAVAIADVKAKGKASGQDVSGNIKATLVFHKTKDGWKVVSGQATPIVGAPPTAKPEDKDKDDDDKKAEGAKPPPPPANK